MRLLEVAPGDDATLSAEELAEVAGGAASPAAPGAPDGTAGAVFVLGSAFGSPGGAPMVGHDGRCAGARYAVAVAPISRNGVEVRIGRGPGLAIRACARWPNVDEQAGHSVVGADRSAPSSSRAAAVCVQLLQLVRHLRRQGYFVAAALTRPFEFEGSRRLEAADALITTLEEVAHLVVRRAGVLVTARNRGWREARRGGGRAWTGRPRGGGCC